MTDEEKRQKFAPGCVNGLDYEYVKWYQMSKHDFIRPVLVYVLMTIAIPVSIISVCVSGILTGVLSSVCVNLPWILLFMVSHNKAVKEAIEANKKRSDMYEIGVNHRRQEAEKLELLRKIAENQGKKDL